LVQPRHRHLPASARPRRRRRARRPARRPHCRPLQPQATGFRSRGSTWGLPWRQPSLWLLSRWALEAGVAHEGGMIRVLTRVTLALPLLGAGIGAAWSVSGSRPTAPICAQAASLHHVGIVVEHGDGQVIRRCVGFDSATATALAVLQASGLEVGTSAYGGGLGEAVCQIDNEPATYPPGCFTGAGSYWVLFVAHSGGAWVNSALGASSETVAAGDDVGFRFDSQTGADPPPASPAGTCPAATPQPARTAAPKGRPTASPRAAASAPSAPPSHSATSVPTAPATAGVLGVATPAASPGSIGSLSRPGSPPGINPGLLLTAVGAGGLLGLLAVRALGWRRR
jgi:hypothetical protein